MAEVSFTGVTKQFDKDVIAVDNLDLQVTDGELLVLVGPSGCGKSTTLRMLAGLEEATGGAIAIGDRVVNDLTPKERDIAMVFQSYALYPHLSVADNLAYPLRLARMSKSKRQDRVQTVARQLRLEDLLDRKPRQLSGGQRQRVAMGRAMVREPKVFLMDEPLSNLDAKLRVLMRSEVAELQRSLGTTMFYVTHDQVEAMTMGDRVAIMNHGKLQQVDAPGELYRNPANLFVAGFIGSPPMNLLVAAIRTGDDAQSVFSSGSASIALDMTGATIDRVSATRGKPCVIGVRPEHVHLEPAGTGIEATVSLIEMLGSESLVHLNVPGLELYEADVPGANEPESIPRRLIAKIHDGEQSPRAGESVGVSFRVGDLHAFDLASGASFGRMVNA